MMFDYTTLSWSKELCGILGIDTDMLPEIVKPTDKVGEVTWLQQRIRDCVREQR